MTDITDDAREEIEYINKHISMIQTEIFSGKISDMQKDELKQQLGMLQKRRDKLEKRLE